ncbi:MAG TPA: class F sortase [Jatrophihabitans sp.]|jgi:hypothetical protein
MSSTSGFRFSERAEAWFFGVLAVVGFVIVCFVFYPRHSSGDIPLPKTTSGKSAAPVIVSARFAKNTMAIPTQKVTAPVQAEAVNPQGYLGIPQDVQVVGYYTAGGKLDGKVGDLVVAGHVNYVGQGTGALGRIGDLHVGDAVITRGNGAPQGWRVTSITSYLKSSGLPRSMFRATGERMLTLVTCGGKLDTSAHSYLSNIVVTAAPVRTIIER